MATIKEMNSIKYGLDSKSLQLLEEDCLRLNDSILLPIKNVSCIENDLKKLISHMKSIREDKFLKKYEKLVEITKVSVQNSPITSLMYFWDPKYQCFTFGNVNMTSRLLK